jgi:hypothetical protein
MIRLALLAILIALGDVLAAGNGPERPPLPYFDWDACPFECCTYRDWRANAPLKVYETRSVKGKVVFEVKQGESVRGVTGVVLTHHYGVSKVLKPIKLGYPLKGEMPVLSLQPGELLYTLHYLGEGFDLFWYKGNLYSDQISAREPHTDPPPPDLNVQVISIPKSEWWVKIRNRQGKSGWSRETQKFDNMDACG